MTKFEQAIHEIYVELYKKATPPADFNKLVEEAPINSEGQKVIPFMDYEIEDEVMCKIIEDTCKKYKLKSHLISSVRTTIYLGCSPKTK